LSFLNPKKELLLPTWGRVISEEKVLNVIVVPKEESADKEGINPAGNDDHKEERDEGANGSPEKGEARADAD